MSEERKAIYYGRVELIPGIICDSYVLDDDTAVMTQQGTADLLGMNPILLSNVSSILVEVIAENSPDKGKKIAVYTAETIETLISTYASAFVNDTPGKKSKSKKNSKQPTMATSSSLMRAVLSAAVREACGLQKKPFQATVRKHFTS
ncbi:MAG: hypothetical protein BWK79_03135 [Beggiatoa sp. IS2]|nr:MAG: hypothetical protein BWK79_03135 [Beggiatoa sp. IS2]